MRGQGAYSTKSLSGNATKTVQQLNGWMRSKTELCWKCQKDVPKKEGKYSFLIRPVNKISSGTSPKKFICFACKPNETTPSTKESQ